MARLVIIESQSGPQPQIWYDEVGPRVKTLESFSLPDCILSRMRTWKIEDAIHFITKETINAA
jgi:hypothetical protein